MDGGTVRRPLWVLIVAVYVGFAVAAPAVIATRKAREHDVAATTPSVGLEALGTKTPVAPASKTATVVMAQIAFKPTQLSVRKGTEVLFANRDVAPHNVTEKNGTIDSGLLNPGRSFRLVVDRSFAYVCTLHPNMKASISLAG
jgi:plastocyanin